MVVGRISRLSADKIPIDWVRTVAAYGLARTRFVVAGDGPLSDALRDDVNALGLGDRFELPGYVARARVPALLTRFDVFCHVTSTAVECHPLALLEALAAGVPVVAEARGGIPEIVTHGVNGLLASSREEIGEHLHTLRRNDALRTRLSVGARRTAPRFSLAGQLTAYRRLLADIDRERRAGAT
jgi:glycosyltransferase involved in cell wall biosynthesis